jgi:DNA-directed RNA polymerase specialized sigma24 family protein
MSLENIVSYPFCRGRCRQCHTPEYQHHNRLCPKCTEFVNQDWVRQSGGILPEETVLKLTDEASARDFWLPKIENEDESCTTEEFVRYLKTTTLSPQQRRISFLLTIEGRTNDEIAKTLKVARGSVSKQRARIAQKLGSCLSPAIYRRGKSEYQLPEPSNSEFESVDPAQESNEETATQRKLLRRVCPRCRDLLFLACKDFQYCMNCLWNSDEDL